MSASTLADLMRAIVEVYTILNDGTKVQIGRRYIEAQDAPPRIVLVPVPGNWGGVPRISAGYVAGLTTNCRVHVWGAEPVLGGDEVENELRRFDDLGRMLNRFAAVLEGVAPGVVKRSDLKPVPDVSIMTHGEACVLQFAYTQGVERDRDVERAITAHNSPRDPDRPNGDSGKTFSLTTTTTATR